ncbi:MAG: holo-ACP synthase [Magnetococcales bacterium]|nr:holo-ACP synthase [Magnetococcales bacterium]
MIVGVGTDLVTIQRIRTAVDRFGARFLERLYSPREVALCWQRRDPVPCLAKRFAAKEAFVKALGTGFRQGIWFRDVEVLPDDLGRPRLVISGCAARQLERFGMTRTHLSLSDEGGHALAFVVVEGVDQGNRI